MKKRTSTTSRTRRSPINNEGVQELTEAEADAQALAEAEAELEGEEVDGEEEAEETKKRPFYIQVAPAELLNEEGKLIGVPQDYDPVEHKAPKRAEFAEDHLYWTFRADVTEARAATMLESAARWRDQAETAKKYGDPETRARVQKAMRLKDQLLELVNACRKDGVDIDDDLLNDLIESDEGSEA